MTLQNLSACLLAMTALVLGSCARTAIIQKVSPHYAPITPAQTGPGSPASPLLAVTADLDAAPGLLEKTPLQAGEKYVAALQSAAAWLDRNPDSREARNLYNFSLGRIFSLIRAQRYEPWGKPFAMGRYTIQLEQAPRYGWDPRQYDFQPDDQVELGGKYITERVVRDGLGATLVAISRHQERNFLKDFSMARNYYGVTAVAEFRGAHCGISFHDPVDDS
ncbi:MAG: hypothetical protein EOP86_19890, partial [Verrucomicrobiaceae bacterium]